MLAIFRSYFAFRKRASAAARAVKKEAKPAKSRKKATVIDAYSLPLKTDEVLKIAQRSGGTIITVEDNYTGGLDAELATAIAETGAAVKLKNLFVHQIPR